MFSVARREAEGGEKVVSPAIRYVKTPKQTRGTRPRKSMGTRGKILPFLLPIFLGQYWDARIDGIKSVKCARQVIIFFSMSQAMNPVAPPESIFCSSLRAVTLKGGKILRQKFYRLQIHKPVAPFLLSMLRNLLLMLVCWCI